MNMTIAGLPEASTAFHDCYVQCAAELAAYADERDFRPESVEPWYLQEKVCVRVGLAGARIVGFCIYAPDPIFEGDVDSEILDIWSRPENRKSGIATRLVRSVLPELRGAVGLQVHTVPPVSRRVRAS